MSERRPARAPGKGKAPAGGGAQWFDAAVRVNRSRLSAAERAALDRLDRWLPGAETLDDVLGGLFERTSAWFPCDRIGLAFIEENGRRVAARWVRAKYSPLRLGSGYAEDTRGSSLRSILESGRLRLIPDLAAYARARPQSRSTRLLLEEGVRSSLTCPLRVDGRPVGLLFRSSRRTEAYTPRHVLLHQALAERIAQAVEKTWRIDRLAEINAAYLEMLGFASHDLRSPLAGIVMAAEVLLGNYLGALESRQRERIELMKRNALQLHAMAGQYLDLARIESGGMTPHPASGMDLWSAAVDPALELLDPLIREGGRRVEQTGVRPLPVWADASLLRTACVNLIGNAVKYGRPGGRIEVAAERIQRRNVLRVWNEGPGFPPGQKPLLFRRFSRLPGAVASGRKGAGLGLYIVWQIAQAHGGRVTADSREGEWAEFRMEWPDRGPRSGTLRGKPAPPEA